MMDILLISARITIYDNAFVQECLQNDFYISTMGYRYENIKEKIEVVMEISFKYDDLKVDICRTYEFDTDIVEMRQHPLMLNRQEKILEIMDICIHLHLHCSIKIQFNRFIYQSYVRMQEANLPVLIDIFEKDDDTLYNECISRITFVRGE